MIFTEDDLIITKTTAPDGRVKIGEATVGGKAVDIFLIQYTGSPLIKIEDTWYCIDMESIVRAVASFHKEKPHAKTTRKKKH